VIHMANKRNGRGGNASRNPRGNQKAQEMYIKKFGRSTKACTGLIHYGEPEVPVTHFRQSLNNKTTFLQSRCDTCNRLYFAVQQKPVKRLAAFVIFAISSPVKDWVSAAPTSLQNILRDVEVFYLKSSCAANVCKYTEHHADYRDTASYLTKKFSGLERKTKNSHITDDNTGLTYPAPQELHDLQNWVGKGGSLWQSYPTDVIWEWWQNFYSNDHAFCSEEENEEKLDKTFRKIPHPLSDFPWGAGNIKDTVEGHSVPAFNQVRAAASILPSASNIGSRVYGFLVEGDHLGMARFSKVCKKRGLSLGHSPAPLRWLGKNDPINGREEPLAENIKKRDSLRELHSIAISKPQEACRFVSWQVRDLVVELGQSNVSLEEFQQRVESEVEKYFDGLAVEVENKNFTTLLEHLKRADPGKTDVVYKYRSEKVADWLVQRPGYKNHS
jgi:hypothetical protein